MCLVPFLCSVISCRCCLLCNKFLLTFSFLSSSVGLTTELHVCHVVKNTTKRRRSRVNIITVFMVTHSFCNCFFFFLPWLLLAFTLERSDSRMSQHGCYFCHGRFESIFFLLVAVVLLLSTVECLFVRCFPIFLWKLRTNALQHFFFPYQMSEDVSDTWNNNIVTWTVNNPWFTLISYGIITNLLNFQCCSPALEEIFSFHSDHFSSETSFFVCLFLSKWSETIREWLNAKCLKWWVDEDSVCP